MSAFEKRLKRRVSGRNQSFFAVCPPGLTALCRKEITGLAPRLDALGLLPPGQSIDDIQIQPGGVAFSARLDLACLANLFLGTPTRVLMRIASFKATQFPAFEKEVREIDWELFLPPAALPRIRVTVRQCRLFHSDAVAQRCHDALLEKNLYEEMNQAPGVTGQPLMDQTLMIRGENDRFEISLDMSGPSLFKRGLKQRVVRAPLRETLAFALLSRLNLTPDDVLVDPMTGSGTFSLEGAMMQANLPPGTFRSFAFEHWPAFQEKRFTLARERVLGRAAAVTDLPPIYASDLDPEAVNALKATCSDHDFLSRIKISCEDFLTRQAPAVPSGKGVVVLNPPYGKRLGTDMDITSFFKEIGRKLSCDYKGFRACVICPSPALYKALDLPMPPSPLFHGGLTITAAAGLVP